MLQIILIEKSTVIPVTPARLYKSLTYAKQLSRWLADRVESDPRPGGPKVGGRDIEFKPKGVGSVLFKHELHVSYKGLKCADCHYKTFQMGGTSYKIDMTALTKGVFCGKCHEGKKAFDVKDANSCKRCHKD